jgi:hypothetical protein
MKTARVNTNVAAKNTTAALAIANIVASKQQCYEAEAEMLFCRQMQEVKEYYDSIKQRSDKEELLLTMLTELEEELDFVVDGDGHMTDECIVALYLTRKCASLTDTLVNAAVATLQDDVTAVAVIH